MHPRIELEQMCRESYKKLCRAERTMGVASLEASISRAEWSAYDRAYRLIFNERIDYYNNNIKMH